MGLGSMVQRLAVKIVFNSKEKLLAAFLNQLNSTYANDRLTIARAVVDHLPEDWKKTATPDEMAQAIDLTKNYVEQMYVLIQEMKKF